MQIRIMASLHRLRKNSFGRRQFPAAAEAATDFAVLTARLEAAPLQNMNEVRVFPQPVERCRERPTWTKLLFEQPV